MLDPILADGGQAYQDVLIHVNIAAYYSYGTAGLRPLIDLLQGFVEHGPPGRFAIVTRNVDVAPAGDAEALAELVRRHGLSVFRTFDEAATAIASAQRFDLRHARILR